MPREMIQALIAGLVGFGLGCALLNIAGGQPLAVVRPSMDMAQVQPMKQQMMPARNFVSRFQPRVQPWQPASRAVFVEAEKEAPGRRGVLTGVASLIPLVAISEKADAAYQKIDPALEAEIRALGGVKAGGAPKVKSFVS